MSYALVVGNAVQKQLKWFNLMIKVASLSIDLADKENCSERQRVARTVILEGLLNADMAEDVPRLAREESRRGGGDWKCDDGERRRQREAGLKKKKCGGGRG
ncbi:hypothetical protein ACOSQ3_028319 [Xanthoceras sorbifolium]